CCGRHRGEDYW
nr:immunoglobulin heavy chain junction region [Macaca mulatta]MOW92448.1 immunoglobulin heavy chain junction region [Macaca mulatta]MOW92676.1 immunoglobulin heavy chain junction region [Macaca mulatta]